MLIDKLKEIGLTTNEIKVYLAGLELGETSIQRIAKKSEIKRTTAYHTVDYLKAKGLYATSLSRGKKRYIAEDPRKLLEKVEYQKKNLEEMMPELLSIANFIDRKPQIKYYEGEQGIKEIYEDSLTFKNSEILAWVNSEAIANFKIEYLKNYYLPQRLKNKIWVRAIAPATEEMKNYQSRDLKSLRKTKLIKNKDISFNTEIMIYGPDKVSIVDFKEKIGLIIGNSQIYETFKKIFESYWEVI
jgi:HTH-type transcriptional regulator, sugar sensing transcriptional regulator